MAYMERKESVAIPRVDIEAQEIVKKALQEWDEYTKMLNKTESS